MLNFRLTYADKFDIEGIVLLIFENCIRWRKVKTSFTTAFAGKGKTMDKEIILAMLEEVGFAVSDREQSLSEIIGTPSHIEISYETEF